MNTWIYLLGEKNGKDVKIGSTTGAVVGSRVKQLNGSQTANESYLLLAAVLGSKKDEAYLLDYFNHLLRTDKGVRKEYFNPELELVEYAAWLRGQWYAATSGDEPMADHTCEDPSHWYPRPERRFKKPPDDQSKLLQDYESAPGALHGVWGWFPNPVASVQDYFTPPEIVNAAKEAMNGITIDVASHWLANKVHKISNYFDITRDAFKNDWYGNIWLNPPYGDNERWFNRAIPFIKSGKVKQMCMISPAWAFTTSVAQPFMKLVSSIILLVPIPKFWRDVHKLNSGIIDDKCGKNHPHLIVYIGDNQNRFLNAFKPYGIPMQLTQCDALPLETFQKLESKINQGDDRDR